MTITIFYACDRISELRSILEIILLESDVEAEDAETQASICPVSHSLAPSSAPSVMDCRRTILQNPLRLFAPGVLNGPNT